MITPDIYHRTFSRLAGVVLLLLLGTPAGWSQEALSLQGSVQFAIQNNPQVHKAAMEVRKGEQLVKEYLSAGLPQLNGSSNLTVNIKLPTQLIPDFFNGRPDELLPVQFGTALNTSTGVELSQLVYDHAFWLGVKATQQLGAFNRLLEVKTQEDVAYNVVKIYMQAQILGKQRGILQANIGQLDGLLRATELQVQQGFAKKLDLDQLRVNRSTLQTQLQNLELQYEQSLRALKYAMAMPLETPVVLVDTLTDEQLPDLISITEPNYRNKIDIAILDQQTELLQLQYKRTQSEFLPTARLFGNYTVQGQANSFSQLGNGQQWFDFAYVGLNVRIPIFDGFRKNARLQQDQIALAQQGKDRELALQGLEFQYSNAFLQLQTSYNNLLSQRDNRRMAEEVYTVAQKRFAEGVASVTEVLSAETARREVQTNFLAALLQYRWASLDLEYANGKLLQFINQ
jgi:outer membrane protein TolC